MKKKDDGLPVTRGEFRKELREVRAALKNCATKKDLRAYATKRDLKAFATKKDLRAYATKRDLADAVRPLATKQELADAVRPLATKKELEDAVTPLALAIVRLQDDVASIKEQMVTKTEFNRIMNALDEMTSIYKVSWDKLTVHDVRIRTLEEHTGLAPHTAPVG